MQLKNVIAWTYSSHPWLWPTYAKSQFAFTRTVEIPGLCLQLRRSGTKNAAQKTNFLTSAAANGCLLPLWKVSLGSNKFLMSYYLFIFSSHQYVQHMTSQILLLTSIVSSLCYAVCNYQGRQNDIIWMANLIYFWPLTGVIHVLVNISTVTTTWGDLGPLITTTGRSEGELGPSGQ